MNIDEVCFRSHTEMAHFQMGVDQGKWGIQGDLDKVSWPKVFLWVRAAPKTGCPDQYFFQFDLAGYPQQAPTARPWDIINNVPLPPSDWPKGPKLVTPVFNPNWRIDALYAPCDRMAMPGHEIWKQTHKGLWWQSDFTIVVYLLLLHKLLNSKDYIDG